MSEFNLMQSVKRRMFALRNGVIADTLRRAGSHFQIIFGLNMPQMVEIADEFGGHDGLAEELWRNKSTRESRLVALIMMGREKLGDNDVLLLIDEIEDVETADMFVHSILRHRNDRDDWIVGLIDSNRPIERYMALRLAGSWVDDDSKRPDALALARKEIERGDSLTLATARRLEYDADW